MKPTKLLSLAMLMRPRSHAPAPKQRLVLSARKRLRHGAFTMLVACALSVVGVVWAAEQRTRLMFVQMKELSVTPASAGATDGDSSIEGRLMQMQYETSPGSGVYENVLISVYADAGVSTTDAWNYDGEFYAARDVFVTRSTDGGET